MSGLSLYMSRILVTVPDEVLVEAHRDAWRAFSKRPAPGIIGPERQQCGLPCQLESQSLAVAA